jgi:hypothetical protein
MLSNTAVFFAGCSGGDDKLAVFGDVVTGLHCFLLRLRTLLLVLSVSESDSDVESDEESDDDDEGDDAEVDAGSSPFRIWRCRVCVLLEFSDLLLRASLFLRRIGTGVAIGVVDCGRESVTADAAADIPTGDTGGVTGDAVAGTDSCTARRSNSGRAFTSAIARQRSLAMSAAVMSSWSNAK